MPIADFSAEPVGFRVSPYQFAGFVFEGGPTLQVRADLGGGANGLTSQDEILIALRDAAAHAYVELNVYNPIEVQALDAAGSPVAPVQPFPQNAGLRTAVFHAGGPAIEKIRVSGSGAENLILVVTTIP